jgi:hypothetical protein
VPHTAIKVLAQVQHYYSRQVETSTYLWSIHLKTEAFIQKQRFSTAHTKEVMKFQKTVLETLYINALTFEGHLQLTDISSGI